MVSFNVIPKLFMLIYYVLHKDYRLSHLHLFADCFMKISLQSPEKFALTVEEKQSVNNADKLTSVINFCA